MFDPSELPATPPAKPPKDPQVFLVGSGTIADDRVNSQPVVSLIHNYVNDHLYSETTWPLCD